MLLPVMSSNRGFHKRTIFIIGNIAIYANIVFPEISSFLPYLHQMISVNKKLDVHGHERITFQGYRFHWSISFLMAQLKRNLQYWHSCVVESLRKNSDEYLSLRKRVVTYRLTHYIRSSYHHCFELMIWN